jgi:hypothetical protein
MTDEQKAAFTLINHVLQPATVAQLAAGGSRDAWIRINDAINLLKPLFSDPPASDAQA